MEEKEDLGLGATLSDAEKNNLRLMLLFSVLIAMVLGIAFGSLFTTLMYKLVYETKVRREKLNL